jgi:peptidoglycan/LPS O-acetylase OafA/YrhL
MELIRYRNIDTLRGIAVIMVISFHFLNNSYNASELTQLNLFEIYLMKITSYGWAGVNLFFVISGFLIGSILLRYKDSPNYFKAFYIRRFTRIIPLYYIFLLLYIAFSLILDNGRIELFEKPIPLFYYFSLVQNFLFSHRGHFGPSALTPTWSLAIEEQFYLIAPIMIRYLSKERLILVSIFFILVSPIFRSCATNWYMEYTHLLGRVDALFLGVLLSVLKMENHRFLKTISSGLFIIVIFVFLLAIYLFISKSINHTLISVGFFYLVLFTFSHNDMGKKNYFLNNAIFSYIGKLSFFLYLFHQMINGLFFVYFERGVSPNLNNSQSYLLEFLALVISLICAILSNKFLESKLMIYGKKFKYSL